MRRVIKFVLSAVLSTAFVGAAGHVLTAIGLRNTLPSAGHRDASGEADRTDPRASSGSESGASIPSFPLFGAGGFETAGYGTAGRFTGPIQDRGSIEQLRDAFASRARRGIAELLSELGTIPRGTPDPSFRALRVQASIVYLLMYEGRFTEAAEWTERALEENPSAPRELRANLEALLGVIHLRRGETENCLDCRGPSSCILPIAPEAVHQQPSGSRAAIGHFTSYLRRRPEDLGVRWLLNLAYMTLGEYPEKVPPEWRIPLDPFRSRLDVGRFENIAPQVGLNARGPNMAGGSVFDDFTGDGLPDVFTTSFDTDLGASLFVNNGDGTFVDRSESAGLTAQPLALNAAQADYDNDGRLDVILLRGGWENAARLTLLHNKGGGAFEDVTVAGGLGEPIASHSAAWGDFDNDGQVDLYVCGEYASSSADGLFAGDHSLIPEDPRNHGRLYRNNGDGTFIDVAERAGVRNDRYAKGCAWGDYDGDNDLDLYISNFGGEERLYRNDGDGTFTDVARELGVTGPIISFPCGFLDFDNDGRLDIFVIDYSGGLDTYVGSALGRPTPNGSHPRLYRNLGATGFRDVGPEVGLDRVVLAMGIGVGDIDNDGFLDIYLGTGRPDYSALMPNVLYKNVEGRRFEDITTSSGTGHLQKGHGVSFADWDEDGDLDLFIEVGGAVPGDRAHNLLFQNPGHGRHWLELKLVGTRTNRAGLGAKIRVDLTTSTGQTRSIFRQVGGTSSYGGSSLEPFIGLGEASSVDALTVTWPASRTSQTFRHLAADQKIEVTEGSDTFHVLKRLTRIETKPRPVRATPFSP
jgi:tetratricopeptide (TPR) repeat protein